MTQIASDAGTSNDTAVFALFKLAKLNKAIQLSRDTWRPWYAIIYEPK